MRFIKEILVLSLVLAGCSSPAVDRVVSSRDTGSDGPKIYARSCGKCHEFYPPSKYTQAEWDKWMTKMRRKSKLKPADFDQVLEFTQMLRNGEAELPMKKK